MDVKPSLGEIAAKATISALPIPGVGAVNEMINGLLARRQYDAEHALGYISERVGEDTLLSIIDGDPERQALLWAALQAIVASGVESKKVLLREVAANALVSTEPIDTAQIQVMTLTELDAPHIRALARLAHAEDRDVAEGSTDRKDNHLETAAAAEPVPVVAALIRTGSVYPAGAFDNGDGTGWTPGARELSVSGVTSFGRELLSSLARAQDPCGQST